jgi:hypothetical protein
MNLEPGPIAMGRSVGGCDVITELLRCVPTQQLYSSTC